MDPLAIESIERQRRWPQESQSNTASRNSGASRAKLRGLCPPPRDQMHLSPWWKSKSTSLTPKSSTESSRAKLTSRNPSEYHHPQVRKVVLSVPISKMSRSSPKVKRSLGLEVRVREDTSLWRSIGKYREKEELGSCQHVDCPKRGWPIFEGATCMLRGPYHRSCLRYLEATTLQTLYTCSPRIVFTHTASKHLSAKAPQWKSTLA